MGICGSSPVPRLEDTSANAPADDVRAERPKSNQVAPSAKSQAVASKNMAAVQTQEAASSSHLTPNIIDVLEDATKGSASDDGNGERPRASRLPQPSMSTRSLMVEAAARQSGQGAKTFLFRCHRSDGMRGLVANSKSVTEVLARESGRKASGKAEIADDGDELAAKMMADLAAAVEARKRGESQEAARAGAQESDPTVIVTAEKIILEDEADARKLEMYGGILGAGDADPGGSSGHESSGVRMYILHTFEPTSQTSRALLATNAPGSIPVQKQIKQLRQAAALQPSGGAKGGEDDDEDDLHSTTHAQGEAGAVSTLVVGLRGTVPESLLAPEAEHVLVRHLAEMRLGYAERVWGDGDRDEAALGEAARDAAAAGRGALCLAPVLSRGVSLDGGYIVEGRCQGASVSFRLHASLDRSDPSGPLLSEAAVPEFSPVVMPIEEAVAAVVGSGAGGGHSMDRVDTWAEARLLPLLLRATERIRVSRAGGDSLQLALEARAADGHAGDGDASAPGLGEAKEDAAPRGQDAAQAAVAPSDAPDAPQPVGHVLARATREAPMGPIVACSKALRQELARARGLDPAAVQAALGRALAHEKESAMGNPGQVDRSAQHQRAGGSKVLRLTIQRGQETGEGGSAGGQARLFVLVSFDPSSGDERRLVFHAGGEGGDGMAGGGLDAATRGTFPALEGHLPSQLLEPEREAEMLRMVCELAVCETAELRAWTD